jgi:hypothetical protein
MVDPNEREKTEKLQSALILVRAAERALAVVEGRWEGRKVGQGRLGGGKKGGRKAQQHQQQRRGNKKQQEVGGEVKGGGEGGGERGVGGKKRRQGNGGPGTECGSE